MHRYILFYKPYEVLCQFSPEGTKKTLAHFFSNLDKDMYPVGRLDYDSEGLLLITNDKQMTHRLLTPAYAHERTYWVQVEGTITKDAAKKISAGIVIRVDGKDYQTKPARAEIFEHAPSVPERNPPIRFRKSVPDSWLSLTLTEGKNRQVRRMTAAVGYPTLRLIRWRIDKWTAEGLSPGEWKEIM